jgi:hypothetical protein
VLESNERVRFTYAPVLEQRLAARLVEPARARRRVQREPIERYAQRPLEHHRAVARFGT